MKDEFLFDVSILVISYKPDLEKLLRTLRSILFQSGVRKQIIVADDGSEQNYFEEIEALFQEHRFSDYFLVSNQENIGITKNFYSGLLKAEGEFLKGISPGDFLYAPDTLSKWYRYMKQHQYDASFGDAVYFYPDNAEVKPVERNKSRPRLKMLFESDSYQEYDAKLNVWVNRDFILGASYFVKTALVLKYCKPLVGTVKYMEDALYRIMLLDGIRTVHYPENIIMYEFGTGVSTTKESKWKKIMREDERAVESIVIESDRNDTFTEKLRRFYRCDRSTPRKRNWAVLRLYPTAMLWMFYRWLMVKLGKCFTDTAYDENFLKIIKG